EFARTPSDLPPFTSSLRPSEHAWLPRHWFLRPEFSLRLFRLRFARHRLVRRHFVRHRLVRSSSTRHLILHDVRGTFAARSPPMTSSHDDKKKPGVAKGPTDSESVGLSTVPRRRIVVGADPKAGSSNPPAESGASTREATSEGRSKRSSAPA